jgi:hypothetical protein
MGFGNWVKQRVDQAARIGAKVPGARTAASSALRVQGALTPSWGPGQDLRDLAFTAAKNITNPAVNYRGVPNPVPSAPVQPIPQGGNVLGEFDAAANTGLYGGGGGGYDEDTDPNKVAGVRSEVQGLMDIFERGYAAAMASIDPLAAEKANAVRGNYGKQREGLQGNFATTSQGIDDSFSARNSYDSSYRENEQNVAKSAFEEAMAGLDSSEQGDLARVGEFANTQRAELNAGRPNFNLGDYSSVSELLDVKAQVDEAVKNIQRTQAGLGTDSAYAANLETIAPVQEQGSTALKAQLDRLANVGAPSDTKKAIAMQAIKDSGEDPAAWLDYFERLTQGQGSQPQATAAV